MIANPRIGAPMMKLSTLVLAAIGVSALEVAPYPVRAEQALPKEIAAPGESVVVTAHAAGAQIYECKVDASGKLNWQFREPIATLLVDGKTMGRHYAGPTWELEDGSRIVGKVLAKVPGANANDIPWLKLEVISHQGEGQLSSVTAVQRINTSGGVPSGPCEAAGALLSAPYSSDYVFLRK
jgi:Protein of unknown function (DUF3455)